MAVDVSERVSANVNGALGRVLPIKLIDATTPALVALCFSRPPTVTSHVPSRAEHQSKPPGSSDHEDMHMQELLQPIERSDILYAQK